MGTKKKLQNKEQDIMEIHVHIYVGKCSVLVHYTIIN